MQIRELSQPVTSKRLNENMAKQLGYKLNLDKFTTAQLEDARNKMRTEMSQFEVSESFDSVNASPQYQKVRMLHDVINQAILEREESECSDCGMSPCECDHDEEDTKAGKKKSMKNEGNTVYYSRVREKAQQYSVPHGWVEDAINRIELGESDQEELASELVLRYDLSESVANHIVYLEEGEEEKAKIIMSTKDMVDRITGWLDDVSAMKAEQLLQLIDSIREELGSDVAEQYTQAIRPALEEIYNALEKTRGSLSSGMGIVSGNGGGEMMGATPGTTPSVPGEEDLGLGGEEPMPGEEPLPGEEEMGGISPAGREKRESVDYSRRLGILLASKKK